MASTGSERDSVPKPGDTIGGRYLLRRVVGAGGMGTVWEATNTWTERRVALKFLSREASASPGSTASTEQVDRFMREARATARVRHPNVVEVLDMGNDPDRGGLYIVYDFLEGETLRARLDRDGTLTPGEAVELLVPAMEGVAEAHRCGVIHRDLKPENIVLTREPRGVTVARVIDFGIAKVDRREGDLTLTRTGVALGTARYMSPEQCLGVDTLDARADVWAFGVVWYEVLTGAVPAKGTAYNQVIASVLTVDAPPLRAALPELPAALAAAVDRSLVRARDARTPSIEAFLADLRAAPPPEAHSPPPEAHSPPPARARPLPLWSIAPVALVLAAAAFSSRAPSPASPPAVVVPPSVLVDRRPSPPEPAVVSADAAAVAVADASLALHRREDPAPRPLAPRPLRGSPVTVLHARGPVASPTPNGAPVLEP